MTVVTYGILAIHSGEINPSKIIDYKTRYMQELDRKKYNRKVEACQRMGLFPRSNRLERNIRD